MDELLYTVLGDGSGLLADRWAAALACGPPSTRPVVYGLPEPPSAAERRRRDEACRERYLQHNSARLPRTCGDLCEPDALAGPAGLAPYRRADIRGGCRSAVSGPPMPGSYDLLRRGRDERTGAPLRLGSSRAMASGAAVVSPAAANKRGLSAAVRDAAHSAKRRCDADALRGVLGSPR